jgi:hypothetical protein
LIGRLSSVKPPAEKQYEGTGGDPWIADAVAKLETLSPDELSELRHKALGGS